MKCHDAECKKNDMALLLFSQYIINFILTSENLTLIVHTDDVVTQMTKVDESVDTQEEQVFNRYRCLYDKWEGNEWPRDREDHKTR